MTAVRTQMLPSPTIIHAEWYTAAWYSKAETANTCCKLPKGYLLLRIRVNLSLTVHAPHTSAWFLSSCHNPKLSIYLILGDSNFIHVRVSPGLRVRRSVGGRGVVLHGVHLLWHGGHTWLLVTSLRWVSHLLLLLRVAHLLLLWRVALHRWLSLWVALHWLSLRRVSLHLIWILILHLIWILILHICFFRYCNNKE